MNDKLTIQELAAYLPWGLEAKLSKIGVFNLDSEYPNEHQNKVCTITNCGFMNGDFYGQMKVNDSNYSFDFDTIDEIDLILLPLPHLTNPKNGVDGITWFDDICWNFFDSRTPDNYECSKIVLNELLQAGKVQMDTYYGLVEYLLKNHFDLFGLIDRGLAISK